MKATSHQKDDPLQMNKPHCKMPYTALHICSVATTLFFLLKEDQGSMKVKNIIFGPARDEGAYLLPLA